jgi:hypothetical protein
MRFKDACIRFRTDEPDYTDLPDDESTRWDESVLYGGDTAEMTPQDAPKPLGRYNVLTHYVDPNLYHDWITPYCMFMLLSFALAIIFYNQ